MSAGKEMTPAELAEIDAQRRADFPFDLSNSFNRLRQHIDRQAVELVEAKRDTERLDWLQHSTNITASEAEAIVNGFVYERRYRGSLRAAIDAAREGEKP